MTATTGPEPLSPVDVIATGIRSLVLFARTADPAAGDELVRDALNEAIYDLDHPPKPDPFTLCECGHLFGRHTTRRDTECVICGCTALTAAVVAP